MVKHIRKFWSDLDWLQQLMLRYYGTILMVLVVFVLGVGLGGCARKSVGEVSTANAIPAAIQSYEVPIADTSTIPELLHLAPGQSAMLLKDVIVVARIPYNGNELYVGEVKIQKGTMLVKPKEER